MTGYVSKRRRWSSYHAVARTCSPILSEAPILNRSAHRVSFTIDLGGLVLDAMSDLPLS